MSLPFFRYDFVAYRPDPHQGACTNPHSLQNASYFNSQGRMLAANASIHYTHNNTNKHWLRRPGLPALQITQQANRAVTLNINPLKLFPRIQ